jgi:2-polyprenyl-3-methyl-5-hydroxy-6-metoxy-1,4-benzoquinol methylase
VSWEYHRDPRPDVQALVSAQGRRILDVGCGGGALGAALKAGGAAWVAGVEYDAAAAAEARQKLDLVVTGDLLEMPLPFAPGEFDYVIFADVLEHVRDPDRALGRFLPFLAPEGRLIVSVPNMRFYTVLLRLALDRWEYTDSGIRDRTHLRIFTRRSLEALLRTADLEIERLTRNFRLLEDQSQIGRVGALATRVVRATVAPLLFRDLMAFQYIAVARRAARG